MKLANGSLTVNSMMEPLTAELSQFDPTAEELETKVEKLLCDSRTLLNNIGNIAPTDVTAENVLEPLLDQLRVFDSEGALIELMKDVSIDVEIQDTAAKLLTDVFTYRFEFSCHRGVYRNLLQLESHEESNRLSAEKRRALKHLISDCQRQGLQLDEATQLQVKQIQTEITALSNQFSKNVNIENTVLHFTKDQLAGLQEDFFDGLEQAGDGSYVLTLKYPHYIPCMKNCRVPDTRQALRKAFNSRCLDENTKILESLVKLRAQKAKLLGYPSHAAFILDKRMAKTPEAVQEFLSSLLPKFKPLVKSERELLLKYKKLECEEYGYEYDGEINPWDIGYYQNTVYKAEYHVDLEKLSHYFPLQTVTKGLFHIYQEVLGVIFTEVEDTKLWHPDAKLFTVTDIETNELVGHFYTDLHPRDRKYSHARCLPINRGSLRADGSRQLPTCCLICNFTKPTKDRPSLLTHDEVTTYFHEFGHAMHNIFGQTETALFSNTNVERDFLEAPSQMLENWCWYYETLRLMTSHYKTGEEIPEKDVKTLAASRKANAGHHFVRQILFAMFDQAMHTRDEVDTAQLFADMSEEITGYRPIPGTNMPASFTHLAFFYDAQYYSYLWSEVFSMDMFASRFEAEGLLNKKTGMDYRRCILEKGGSQDGADMLRKFLGRDPTTDAFLKQLSLNTT